MANIWRAVTSFTKVSLHCFKSTLLQLLPFWFERIKCFNEVYLVDIVQFYWSFLITWVWYFLRALWKEFVNKSFRPSTCQFCLCVILLIHFLLILKSLLFLPLLLASSCLLPFFQSCSPNESKLSLREVFLYRLCKLLHHRH